MRSARSSGQRPNRQLVATRRHGAATINSIRRLSLTLTGSPRFMKYAAATSGHQFPLVRFPVSRATLEFTTKFIVMLAGCSCATAAPHTLRYIHCFARVKVSRERRRFVGGAFAIRALTGGSAVSALQCLKEELPLTRLRQARTSRRSNRGRLRLSPAQIMVHYHSMPGQSREATTIAIDRNSCELCDTDRYGRSARQLAQTRPLATASRLGLRPRAT